jgi:PCO_ADO
MTGSEAVCLLLQARKKEMRNTFSDIDFSISSAPAKELEVFPGVHERRYFLRGSLTTVAAILALRAIPKSVLAQTPIKATGIAGASKLTWDDFLKQSVPIAQQLIADPAFSVDEYLYRIGSLATRLKEIPDSPLGSYKTVDPRVWFGPSFRGSPFFIIQWRMEPGAVLPAHNHPNASVCTLGYEGEVRLRNFEVVGEAPDYASKKTFRVRETRNETMTGGRINTLSPQRDNIHCFRVGTEGARGIDINTLHGKIGPFSFLDLSEKPVDSEKRIFEATWNPQLGQPPASKP